MSEKPIIFSGPMVRAILEGRKTQTRRVIKPQPPSDGDYRLCTVGSSTVKSEEGKHHWATITEERGYPEIVKHQGIYFKLPYSVGDVLWVRETWCELFDHHRDYKNQRQAAYRASTGFEGDEIRKEYGYKWKPPIFMPRWAARIFLEVTAVRVERVQEISFEDCRAEGCNESYVEEALNCEHPECKGKHYREKYHFQSLWDSLNAKRGYGWEVNPWVGVYEFKVKEAKS